MTLPSDHGSSFEPSVFICYRRSDASGEAAHIADRLSRRYGEGQIFLDVKVIQAGVNYERALERARQGAQVMLTVIGMQWIQSATEAGRRRLDDEADYVRIEIHTALSRGIRLLPILVQGATMPSDQDLPFAIRELAKIQAIPLRHDTFERDFLELQNHIDQTFTVSPSSRAISPCGPDRICVGGTISPGSEIYIERPSDARLLDFLRAYPSRPAARQVMRPHAKCSMAI